MAILPERDAQLFHTFGYTFRCVPLCGLCPFYVAAFAFPALGDTDAFPSLFHSHTWYVLFLCLGLCLLVIHYYVSKKTPLVHWLYCRGHRCIASHLPWSRCAPWPVPLAHPCTSSAGPYTNAYSWGIPPIFVCVKSVFDFVLLFLTESLTRLSTFPALFLSLFRLGLGWYIYVIYAPEISCTPI